MAKKMEVREGDYLTVRLPVRVARDGPLDECQPSGAGVVALFWPQMSAECQMMRTKR